MAARVLQRGQSTGHEFYVYNWKDMESYCMQSILATNLS